MKIRFLLILSFLFITISCAENETTEQEEQQDNLVLSEMRSYHVIYEEGIEKEEELFLTATFAFNSNRLNYINQELIEFGNAVNYEQKIIYQNEQIERLEEYRKEVLELTIFYAYLEDSKIKITNDSDNSYRLYSFENDKMIEVKHYENGGSLNFIKEIKYDLNGNAIKIIVTDFFTSNERKTIFEFEYDAMQSHHKNVNDNYKFAYLDGYLHWFGPNNILSASKYNEEDELIETIYNSYEYNSEGYPISVEVRNMENIITEKTTFTYK